MSDKPDVGFVSVTSLKGQAPKTPAEIIADIRRIYFKTTKQTIQNDFAHAIELLKSLPDEDTREKAHVYMEGLAEMRKEWMGAPKKRASNHKSKIKNQK
jgi:hypothetical protein